MKDAKKLVAISKRMSFLLRHKPEDVGLTLDGAGWCDLKEFLEKTETSLELVEEVVTTNSKKRFEFNEDKTKIRASQGHSIEVDLQYEETLPPEFLFHGTSGAALEVILREGLKKMDRHHVHLSVDHFTALEVGRRRGPGVALLCVLAAEMASLGFKFYRSTNAVWLVDAVPAQFLAVVRP